MRDAGTETTRFRRAVVVGGFVRGCWDSHCTRGAVAIEVRLFEKTAKSLNAEVAAEAEALLHMLEPDASTYAVRVTPMA